MICISVQFSARSLRVERHLAGDIAIAQLGLDALNFTPAGRPVYWQWDGFVELLQIQLSRTFLLELASQYGLDTEKLLALDRLNVRDPMVAQIAHELANFMLRVEKQVSTAYLDSLAKFLILHLAQGYCRNSENVLMPEDPATLRISDFSRVIKFMHENLDKDLRLDQLARIAKLSNFYFIKQFRAAFGTSPHQYILGCRIDLAKRLLTESFFSIGYISQRCGFSSQSHFTSAFRQNTGIPPRLFRHNNRPSKAKRNLS